MGSTLPSFLQASKESERESSVSDLILVHAAPLIRHVLREQLGLFVNQHGANPNNPEAEDLYHDVITKLVHRLRDRQAHPEKDAIRNFRHYVKRVATNACNDYVRTKTPARARLKNSLRDLITRHEDFSMWRDQANEWVCGFVKWRNGKRSGSSSDRLKQLKETPTFSEQLFFHAKIFSTCR